MVFDTLAGGGASLLGSNTSYRPGQRVTARGYWLPGDGGGGTFYWEPTSTCPADDALVFAPRPEVSGRWFREDTKDLSILCFGIPRDAQRAPTGASNVVRLQRALSRAKVGGTISFPKGRYLVEGTLDLSGARGLTLRAEGQAALLLHAPDVAIFASDVVGLTMRGLDLGGAFGRGIVIDGSRAPCRDVVIASCSVTGANRPASPATAAIHLIRVESARVEGCIFSDVGGPQCDVLSSLCVHVSTSRSVTVSRNVCDAWKANMGIGVADSSDCIVADNFIRGCRVRPDRGAWGYGIYFYRNENAAVPTERNQCRRNTIRCTGGTGIYVQGSSRTIIDRNRVEDSCLQVAGLTLATGGIALNAPATDCTLSSNVVTRTGNSQMRCPGIRFDAARTIVEGNIVTRARGDGVQYNGSPSAAIIRDNRIIGSGGSGIAPYSTITGAVGLRIYRNTVDSTGSGAPGISCQGVSTGEVKDLVISGNLVCNASGSSISVGNAESFAISDNLLVGAGPRDRVYAGIYVATSSTGLITDNVIDFAEARAAYGIQLADGRGLTLCRNIVGPIASERIHVAGGGDITLAN